MYAGLSAVTLPKGWIVNKFDDEIRCVLLRQQQLGTPVMIFHVLRIRSDLTWELRTVNHFISPESDVLCQQPTHLTVESAERLIHYINSCHLCTGNSDIQFVELAKQRKGRFLTTTGETIAFLEEDICFSIDGGEQCSTIRHKGCAVLLSTSGVCSVCSKYRNTLRVLLYRHKKLPRSPHPNKNIRFFTTPERRAHSQSLRKAIRNKNRQLARLRAKLEMLVENNSVEVDDDLDQDLRMMVEDCSNVESVKDEFKRIFWEQQVCMELFVTTVLEYLLILGSCLQNQEEWYAMASTFHKVVPQHYANFWQDV